MITSLLRTHRGDAEMACSEAIQNIDWQYSNNLFSDFPDFNPLAACSAFASDWKFDSARGSLYQVDSRIDATKDVINYLKQGQHHNQGAMNSYDACLRETGSIFNFMLLVVSAAPGLAADLSLAATNIAWQNENNSQSIADAKRYWTQAATVNDSDAKNYFKVLAMFSLMFGQRHNINVMRLYRACFRDNAPGLFGLL